MGHRFYVSDDGSALTAEDIASSTHDYGLYWTYGQHDHDGNTTPNRSLFKKKGFYHYLPNGSLNIDWDVPSGASVTWVYDHDGYLKGYSYGKLRTVSHTTINENSTLYLSFANGTSSDAHTFPPDISKKCLDYRLTAPNGNETLTAGEQTTITWENYGSSTHVKLSYSTDNFASYPITIIASTENDGSFEWTIPEETSSTVKVRVEDATGEDQSDSSDFYFTLQLPPDEDLDGIPDSLDTDDDNDGVNDSDEALLGTNPLVADTDGDGTSDGDADADNDGISNADESDASSASATDSDGDGNADISNPADTDSDGIANDTDTDDDNDGVNDSDELLAGTNPLLADSDSDGTADGLLDSDADGLSNSVESDANSASATDSDGDGNPDITTFTNNLISGFTHVDGTTNIVDSDTLAAGSAVSYDTTLEAGTRLILSKEWVESVVLPAIASDTGERIVVGVRDSSADLSDGLVISEFAFHFNWERDSDPSVNGYVASLEDEVASSEDTTGTIFSLTDSPYDYAVEYDGTNIYLIYDSQNRLSTEPSVTTGGNFSHTKLIAEATKNLVAIPLEITIWTENTTLDITGTGLSKITIPSSDDIDGDGILDVVDLDTNDGPFGDLDQDGIANNVDLDNTDGPKMSASFITQFGSTTTETISNFAITSDGSFLFVGRTLKSWSGVTVIEPYDAGDDIYVAKYNPTIKSVEWITYLGSGPGAGTDYGYDIAVDGNDDFAVVGSVGGSLAHHGAISTNGNGVIAKFNAAGELQWLTHAGAPEGSGSVSEVAVDSNNYVYAIVSSSGSSVNGVGQRGGVIITL